MMPADPAVNIFYPMNEFYESSGSPPAADSTRCKFLIFPSPTGVFWSMIAI